MGFKGFGVLGLRLRLGANRCYGFLGQWGLQDVGFRSLNPVFGQDDSNALRVHVPK